MIGFFIIYIIGWISIKCNVEFVDFLVIIGLTELGIILYTLFG